MPTTTSFSLTAPGTGTHSKPVAETVVYAAVSGTHSGASFVLEGTLDGLVWFELAVIDLATGDEVSGVLTPTAAASAAWAFYGQGLIGARLRLTALTSGQLDVRFHSGEYQWQKFNPPIGTNASYFSMTLTGSLTMTDGTTVVLGTAGGTQIGTAPAQLLALWGATPVVQPASADQADPGATTLPAHTFDGLVGSPDPVDTRFDDLMPVLEEMLDNLRALTVLSRAHRLASVGAGVMKGGA